MNDFFQGEYIEWECPECETTHQDPEYISTHCRKCGLVVIAASYEHGGAVSEKWYVDIDKYVTN